MSIETLAINLRSDDLEVITEKVKAFYRCEKDVYYHSEKFPTAILRWFEEKVDSLVKNAPVMFTTPHLPEEKGFAKVLERTALEFEPWTLLTSKEANESPATESFRLSDWRRPFNISHTDAETCTQPS